MFEIVAVLTAGRLEQPIGTLSDFGHCLRVPLAFAWRCRLLACGRLLSLRSATLGLGLLRARGRLCLPSFDDRLAFSSLASGRLVSYLRHAFWFRHPCPQIQVNSLPDLIETWKRKVALELAVFALPCDPRSGRLLIHPLDRRNRAHIRCLDPNSITCLELASTRPADGKA
jgi:hypothetical protein